MTMSVLGTEIRVQLVGGTRLTRELFKHLLTEAGMQVTGTTEPTSLASENDPSLLSVLINEEGDPSWLFMENRSHRSVIVTQPSANNEDVELVLHGADGIINFDASANDLAQAVRIVASGGSFLTPFTTRRLSEIARANKSGTSTDRTTLTARELDILLSIGRGESVKQTASTLGISAKTVENLQSRLFRKLNVRNRAQAFAQAHAMGLLPPAHETEVVVEEPVIDLREAELLEGALRAAPLTNGSTVGSAP